MFKYHERIEVKKEASRFYQGPEQTSESKRTQTMREFILELLTRDEAALAKAMSQQKEYERFHADNSFTGRIKKATEGMFVAYRPDMSSTITQLNNRIATLRETLSALPDADLSQLEQIIVKELEALLFKINFLRSDSVEDMGTRDMALEEIEQLNWFYSNGIAVLKTIDSNKYDTYAQDLQQRTKPPRLSY